jgi:hypothetical protein
MNGKAYALWGLGSFEEAAREMDAARRLLENGRPNVSETLNMAEMYCRLGEHDRAPARGVRVVSLGSIGLVLS